MRCWIRARLFTALAISRTTLSKRPALRPCCVDVRSSRRDPRVDADAGRVVDRDRLHLVRPSPGTRKSGARRRIHAMLLIRMSSAPEDERRPDDRVRESRMRGRAPPPGPCRGSTDTESRSPGSRRSRARRGESPPARRRRAGRRCSRRPRRKWSRPRSKRTQYVLYSVSAPRRLSTSESSKTSGAASMREASGSDGWRRRVSVRTLRPRPRQLLRDVPAGVRERSGDDVERGHAAQPGFFATQISSAGHLRAHSAEKVS